MKKVAVMALAGALSFVSGCDVFTSVDERVARAEQLESNGAYREAMIELNNVLSEDPQHPRAQLVLARAGLQVNNLIVAEKALAAAETARVDARDAAAVRARLLLAKRDFAGLLAALETNGLPLDESQHDVLEVQALAGLGRCRAAIAAARALSALKPQLVRARIAAAECHGRRGDAAAALRELDAAQVAAPQSAEVLMARGRALQMLGRAAEAQATWMEAIELLPGGLSIAEQLALLSTLVDLQIDRHELAPAKVTLQMIQRLGPNGAAAELALARMEVAEGASASAATRARKVLQSQSDFAPARRVLVSALLADGKIEQAKLELGTLGSAARSAEIDAVLKIVGLLASENERDETYWLRLAAAQSALREPAAARMALNEALRVAPKSIPARIALGELQLRAGFIDDALRHANAVLEGEPTNLPGLQLRADARVADRQFARAAQELDDAWTRKPSGTVAVMIHRVREQGALAEPLEPLERWLKIAPEDVAVRGLYASAMEKEGDASGAIAQYETIVGQARNHVPALNNLAVLYQQLNDERAIEVARRAQKLAPKTPQVLDTLGWVLVASGDISAGLPLLEAAYQAAGRRMPDIAFHYAVALAKSGQRAQAREILNQALEEHASFSTLGDAEKLLATLG